MKISTFAKRASRLSVPRQRPGVLYVRNVFSGIVQGTATVQRLERKKDFTTLVLRFPENLASSVSIGSSVAINGACLTATSVQNDVLTFDAIGETLNVTNLSQLEIGSVVNYEK